MNNYEPSNTLQKSYDSTASSSVYRTNINNNSTTRENKLALLPTSKYSASITSSSNMNNLNDYEHFNYRPSPRSSYLNQHLAYNNSSNVEKMKFSDKRAFNFNDKAIHFYMVHNEIV